MIQIAKSTNPKLSFPPTWWMNGSIIHTMQKTFSALMVNLEGCTGGYFCIAEKTTGRPFLLFQFGGLPPEKAEKYLQSAKEKARRLAMHKKHTFSWESRIPDKKFGGAVKGRNFIFSFSGFPELADEAGMIVVAYQLGELSEQFVDSIDEARNPYLPKLFSRICQKRPI